ncbi:hypothetical protein CIK05_07820 [Bdellovibrio sp. qaytius]|nr:hypothetical protein CIK05_07820 [Bdellovibrio sp. qaytius]
MKNLLAVISLFISINAHAFTQKTELDFTNLYGNTNAGVYEMNVSFKPKTTKSFSGLTYSSQRIENQVYCVSTVSFEIGQMLLTLTDVKTGWSFTTAKPVFASTSIQSENETCINDATKFVGNQNLYASLNMNEPIQLPAKAPFDYEKVGAYINPYVGYLYLKTEIKTGDFEFTIDPSQMLTEKSITDQNKNNAAVTYYVFTTRAETTLALGTGLVKF